MLLFRCVVIFSLGVFASASFHHNPIFARVFGSDAPLAQKFFGHNYNNYEPVNWWEPQEPQNFEPQIYVYEEDNDDDDEPYPEPQPVIIEDETPEPAVITIDNTPKKEYNFNTLPHFDIQNRFRTETVFKPQKVTIPQTQPENTNTKANTDGEHIFNLLPHYDRKHVFRSNFPPFRF